jgi:hypothetical protein
MEEENMTQNEIWIKADKMPDTGWYRVKFADGEIAKIPCVKNAKGDLLWLQPTWGTPKQVTHYQPSTP